MESTGFVVGEDQVGVRIDKLVSDLIPELTRSQAEKLLADGKVLVDGSVKSKDYTVKIGDPVTVIQNIVSKTSIEIPIIYEDEDVIVINKPAGVLTHAKGAADDEFTVVDAFKVKIDDGESNRPGIVHRLDRDTSGVMIIAKNSATKNYLQKQFENRQVAKTYVAIVKGTPKDEAGIIKWPIERNPKKQSTFRIGKNGKPAETEFKVLESNKSKSKIECKPRTGRTHQLRVHLAYMGHPIDGDALYGGSEAERMMLHAHKLEISIRHNDRQIFIAPVPSDFRI